MSKVKDLQKENDELRFQLNELKNLKRYPVVMAASLAPGQVTVILNCKSFVMSHGMSVVFVPRGK